MKWYMFLRIFIVYVLSVFVFVGVGRCLGLFVFCVLFAICSASLFFFFN